MANNHMGDVNHGLRIIREFAESKIGFDFNFAFKFQFRDLDTFIHPSFNNRQDLKYVKRFKETKLKSKELEILKNELDKYNFKSICTPFDEKSVSLIEDMGFDAIKIASCSFTDWPLLESIAQSSKPIIASTAGAKLEDIDKVVSFFTAGEDNRLTFDTYRNKEFAIMHCVGEYPTETNSLRLNQITLLKNRYPNIAIGFSTHEDPDDNDAIKMAVAKGAQIFEKHVAVETDVYKKNAYSATPDQIKNWLISAKYAFEICGDENIRAESNEKEISDLLQFKRGVYASTDIRKNEILSEDNVFYAFPNQPGQLLANDMSNTLNYKTKDTIKKLDSIQFTDVTNEVRKDVQIINDVISDVKKMLINAKVVYPGKANFELSHHYGINKIRKFGTVMLTVVNREYCKKLLIVLPGQKHPEQYHKVKEETFHILHGELIISLNGNTKTLKKGDICTIERGINHSFLSDYGAIVEEISTTHKSEDSYYTDPHIMNNKERKTIILN